MIEEVGEGAGSVASGNLSSFTLDSLADARLAAIVDGSFDAIISKNLDTIITTWNPAAERLFGYSADEAIGKSIRMLIPDHLQSEEEEIIGRIKRGERLESFDTTRMRKDGTFVSVSITVSPIRDASGRIVGASKIARDISEARSNEKQIRLLLREIDHRVKNQFAVVLSIVRQSRRAGDDPQQFEERVAARIASLARSHDLLVHSKWVGGSLAKLVRSQMSPFAREDQIVACGPPITLKPAAVQYLGMALHELGTNAAKHGALAHERGRVEVSWSAGPSEIGGGGELTFRWREVGAAAPDHPQTGRGRRGFGTVVLHRVVPQALDGRSALTQVNGGRVWELSVPLSQAVADSATTKPPLDVLGEG